MADRDDISKLLETLKNGGVGKSPADMTLEEITEHNEAQFKKVMENFKKIETKDIIHMLVSAENLLIMMQREDPPLKRRHAEALHNARIFISCILDGKLPTNWDDIKPYKKD